MDSPSSSGDRIDGFKGLVKVKKFMLHLVQAESPSLTGVFLFDTRKLLLPFFGFSFIQQIRKGKYGGSKMEAWFTWMKRRVGGSRTYRKSPHPVNILVIPVNANYVEVCLCLVRFPNSQLEKTRLRPPCQRACSDSRS